MTMINLGWLIPYKFQDDEREPLFTFPSPISANVQFGFYAPELLYWVEALGAVICLAVVSAMMSTLTYYWMVEPRHSSMSTTKTTTTTTMTASSFLLGFGLILPFWIRFPYVFLDILDIRNKMMRFCACGIIPTLAIFRTTEAIFDCVPLHASKSVFTYALYFGSPMTILQTTTTKKKNNDDDDTQKAAGMMKATTTEKEQQQDRPLRWVLFFDRLRLFVVHLFLVGILQSYLTVHNFFPFDSPRTEWYDLTRLHNSNQIFNNIFYALMFQGYLKVYSEGLITATILFTGRPCQTMVRNPLLTITTPSEFWSERWNTVVHSALKGGIYKPCRKLGFGRAVGVVAAFVASGLFHEWLLTAIFSPREYDFTPIDPDDPSSPLSCQLPKCLDFSLDGLLPGGSLAFMVYNAVFIVLEHIMGKWAFFRALYRTLPNPILTFLLVCLGLPVAHWFTEPYFTSDFYRDGGVGLPMILPLLVTNATTASLSS